MSIFLGVSSAMKKIVKSICFKLSLLAAAMLVAVLSLMVPLLAQAAEVIQIPSVPSAQDGQFSALADAAMDRDMLKVQELLSCMKDKTRMNTLQKIAKPANILVL